MNYEDEHMGCCYACDNLFMAEKYDLCGVNKRKINQPGETCPPSWCSHNKTMQSTEKDGD